MKKTILVLTSVFLTASVFAAPKVGDTASMEGSTVEGGVSKKMTTTQTVMTYTVSTGIYVIRQSQTIGGVSEEKTVSVSADDILSEETAAEIVTACESDGLGKNEVIEVKAGKFNTCKLKSESGSVWLGPVPFGVVRFQSTAPLGNMEMQLHRYVRGN